MASSAGQSVIRHLRRAALGDGDGRSDSQLLEAFIARRDESAFALLLRRHGPMVLGVCRRVVGHHADAEDAFQAVFVVLARKAASLTRRDLLGNWLYGVAYRTALEARTRMLRLRSNEKQVADFPQPLAHAHDDQSDLLGLLDRELNRLADRYRAPVVLCELQGHSRKDAARLLGIPEGTLSSRLAMARKLLASRLARRGATVSIAAILSQAEAPASVSGSLIESTLRMAAAETLPQSIAVLTQGVLKSMFITKLKLAAVIVACAGITAGTLSYGVASKIVAAPQDEKKADQKQPPSKPRPTEKPKSDQDRLQGAWKVTDVKSDGAAPANARSMVFYFVKDKTYLGTAEKVEVVLDTKLDPKASPKQITLAMPMENQKLNGIYTLSGDQLKMAFPAKPGDDRPTDFDAKDHGVVFELQHDPKAKIPDPKDLGNKLKTAAARTRSTNSMKQILLAMHGYHDVFKGFPPSAIVDKNGKALLSWRVAILPFIEQDGLYKAFKLDEPWDSAHNKKLLAQMPKIFGEKGNKTHFRLLVGEGAAFEGTKIAKLTDFTDGTSNTILIVEAPDAVEWTKPEELEYDAKKPLPKLGGTPYEAGFHVGMADGSVRFMSIMTPEKILRALITRNGNETIEP
jgi:RNA polymerase sigma factor (sigma-70 family)